MRQKKLIIINGALAIVAVAFIIVAIIASGGSSKTTASSECQGKPSTVHTVTIKDDAATPTATYGKLCDTLTITNDDHVVREIAFGPHEDHVPYDGVAEKVLSQGQSLTITLNKEGTYHFHDHEHDEVAGYFVVYNR